MIMSHMLYCVTSWAAACKTALKPIETVYKQALKVLDKKPKTYHHCQILKKHERLNWDNTVKHTDAVLMYKIFHGQAPPPLQEFVKKNSNRSTRAGSRGDCVVPFRKSAHSQATFSVRASHTWNSVPSTIRKLPTLTSFTKQLKAWLLEEQHCCHRSKLVYLFNVTNLSRVPSAISTEHIHYYYFPLPH